MHSTSTSSWPPQMSPLSYEASCPRLNDILRGFSVSMTSRAAFQTSASTQPPPTVPMKEPSSRTRILALSKLGIEPFTCTMVATAHFCPRLRRRTISSYKSIWIDYIVDPPRRIIAVVDGHQATDLVTIRQFGNLSEALMAKGCLESAGIECFLADANMAWMDSPVVRGMRLQVNPEDAQTATAFLESVTGDSNR